MSKKIILISKITAYLLMGIAAVFQVLTFIYSSNYSSPTPEAMSSPLLGNYLIMGYVVFGIALLVAVIFPVIRMISNPKNALKGLLGIAVILVLALISYFLSSNELSALQLEKLRITESMSVLVGAGLYLTYIIGVITLGAGIFLAIRGTLSK